MTTVTKRAALVCRRLALLGGAATLIFIGLLLLLLLFLLHFNVLFLCHDRGVADALSVFFSAGFGCESGAGSNKSERGNSAQ